MRRKQEEEQRLQKLKEQVHIGWQFKTIISQLPYVT